MTKLCVIDKDGTLTKPISIFKFPQNPTDQMLLPGVKEAIDRLRADGWHLAIASNQGGCDWHEVCATSLTIGQRFQIPEDEEDENPFLGDTFTVVSTIKEVICSQECMTVETGSQDFTFGEGDRVLVQYKTIEQVVQEVAFAADLCGITEAYFCPDMAGKVCINLTKTTEPQWDFLQTNQPEWKHGSIPNSDERFDLNFRKPNSGMLEIAAFYKADELDKDLVDLLMIGDRDSDKQAAIEAGFKFMIAEEFRNLGQLNHD